MMWEVETGRQYKMTRAHDIYSGLGSESGVGDGDISTASNSDTIEEEAIASLADGELATEVPEEATKPVSLNDSLQRKREDLIAREISRAEAIVSTFDGVKVYFDCYHLFRIRFSVSCPGISDSRRSFCCPR